MPHTRVWDSSYEADPANTDNASEGAQRIRELKVDIRERMEVDHYFGTDTTDDGRAKKTTFKAQGSAPTSEAGYAHIYGKTVSGTTKVIHKNSAGTEADVAPIPAGTKMLFAQASAPTGWTKDVDQNDRVLRVVSGTGAATGGSWTISGISVNNHTLTVSQMPAHNHPVTGDNHNHSITGYDGFSGGSNIRMDSGVTGSPINVNTNSKNPSTATSNTGGGTGHNHGLTIGSSWRPAYLDVIKCTKD